MKKTILILITTLILFTSKIFCQSATINANKDIAYPLSQKVQAGDCLGPQLHNLNCSFLVSDIVTNGTGMGSCSLTLKSISFSYGGDFYYLDSKAQKKTIPSSELQLNGIDLNRNVSISYSLNGTFEGTMAFILTQGSSIQLSFLPKKAEALKNNPSILSVSINLGMGFTWSNISNYCGQVQSIINKQQQANANTSKEDVKKAGTSSFTKNSSSTNSSSTGNKNNSQNSIIPSSSSNNSAQQIYNQTIANNKTIQQNTANANQAINNATTAIWGTAAERKAEKEKKEQKESENEERVEKARQEKYNRELQNDLDELENYKNKIRDNYKNSDWGNISEMHSQLNQNQTALNDWILACKSNNKSGFENYLKKNYNLLYFNDIAKLMIIGWDKGNKSPSDYIKIAIQEQSWPLVKYLLDNGGRVSYEEMDPSNFNHTPVNDCISYAPHQELSLTAKDKAEMIKQLVLAGANINTIFQIDRFYQVKTIEQILFYDYKGELFKWLVDNNKINGEDQAVALKALSRYYGNNFQHYGQLYFNNYKEYFKISADHTQIVAIEEGAPNAKDNLLLQLKYLLENKQTGNNIFKLFIENTLFWPPPANENCNRTNWIEIQEKLINRLDENNKTDYLLCLARELIEPHHSNYKINIEDTKKILAAIIRSGINPNQKILRNGFNSYVSIIALAKEKNSELYDFLRDKNNFK